MCDYKTRAGETEMKVKIAGLYLQAIATQILISRGA